MYCQNCGNELPNGVTICLYCGTTIQAPQRNAANDPSKILCQNCGDYVTPSPAPFFKTKEIVIAVFLLFLGFVPALLYVGYKYYSKKDLPRGSVCPICKKPLSGVTTDAGTIQPNQITDTIKNVVTNKDVQRTVIQGARDIKEAGKGFVNSLDINNPQ